MTRKKKNVALVLSSGGARGLAGIGAIEELENQGYNITSVAGTSMGSLIGGMYATGKLPEVKEWLLSIDKKKMFSLIDFSVSTAYVVKGERIINAMQQIVPDCNIEELKIPYCAVATNIQTGSEVVFSKGSLYEAIRSSISLPLFFRPEKVNNQLLVDGGLVNGLPLNRVARKKNDILVAVNVSAIDYEEPELGNVSQKIPDKQNYNYISMLSKLTTVLIQQNILLSMQITPPDVVVSIPSSRFESFDYFRAEEIIRNGKEEMHKALELYESERIIDSYEQ